MTRRILSSRLFSLLRKLFVITCILIFLLVCVAGLLLFFLPELAGSDMVRTRLESTLSDQLQQTVAIKGISFDWQSGIILQEFTIAGPEDDPASIARVESLRLTPSLKHLLKRTIRFEFKLAGLELNLVKDGNGRINLLPPAGPPGSDDALPPEPPPNGDEPDPPEKAPARPAKPFVLPVEVIADIEITDIFISFDDQGQGRRYRLSDGGIRLDIPSLKTRPIRLDISANMAADEHGPEAISLTATASDLFKPDGTLNTDGLSANMQADLPGIRADVNGGMADSGLDGNIRVDLARLVEAAAPFVPDALKDAEFAGIIELSAGVSRSAQNAFAIDGQITGSGLKTSGAHLQNRSVGPADFGLTVSAQARPDTGTYALDKMTLTLQQNTTFTAAGRFRQEASKAPEIAFTLSPARIDLNEILALAHDFLPGSPKMEIDPDRPAHLVIDRVQAESFPSGDAFIELSGLVLHLPDLLLPGDKLVAVRQPSAAIRHFRADLSGNFPTAAAMTGSLSVKAVEIGSGEEAIRISGIELNDLDLAADGIQKIEGGTPGLAADIKAGQRISIARVDVADRVRISGIEQAAALTATLAPDGAVNGILEKLALRITDLSIDDPKLGIISTAATLDARMTEFRRTPAGAIDVTGASVDLTLPDLLELALGLDAQNSGQTALNASGDLRLHLDKLIALLPDDLRSGITAGGTLSVAIDAVGRLPDEDERSRLAALDMKNHLPFMKKAAVNINLSDASLSVNKEGGRFIDIQKIEGLPVLGYTYRGGTGRGEFESRLHVGGIDAASAPLPASTQCDLLISGSHQDLNAFEFSQELSVQPFEARQQIMMSVDGLARLIASGQYADPVTALNNIGGSVSVTAAISDLAAAGMEKMTAKGGLSAKADIRLVPGRNLSSALDLDIAALDIAAADRFALSSLAGTLRLEKSWIIAGGRDVVSEDAPDLLSQRLMAPASFPDPARAAGRMEDLAYLFRRPPDFTLSSCDVTSLPVPVHIRESRLSVSLNGGFPVIEIATNLLNGSIAGSAGLVRDQDQYYLQTRLAFSGIDSAALIPDAAKIEGADTEINGSLSARIPLTRSLQGLLENTRVQLYFSRIGSRALERILYALDPYESNEAIMSQRRLLRTGSPKEIRLEIENGFLSLEGSVSAASITIAIPRLQRFNIAQIPGIKKYESNLAAMVPLISMLDILTAETLIMDPPQKRIRFE